jgi:Na+/alanine symporter
MTFPNLLAINLISGSLKKLTKDYFAIDHREYSKIKDKVTD